MKYCPKCNKEFEKGNFCKYCGGQLSELKKENIKCPKCYCILKGTEKFCSKCGVKLEGAFNENIKKEKKIFESIIPMPWETDFDSFISDKNSKMIFK